MRVFFTNCETEIEIQEKVLDLPDYFTVEDLLNAEGIDPGRIYIVNAKFVDRSYCLKDADKIKVLPLISGG